VAASLKIAEDNRSGLVLRGGVPKLCDEIVVGGLPLEGAAGAGDESQDQLQRRNYCKRSGSPLYLRTEK
jgi:hypothetical protein